MVNGLVGVDPKRKQRLLEVLDIDLEWRMHLVSDGQRRRVQLLMGLLKPFEVGQRKAASSFLPTPNALASCNASSCCALEITFWHSVKVR